MKKRPVILRSLLIAATPYDDEFVKYSVQYVCGTNKGFRVVYSLMSVYLLMTV